jgi:hypothetical protein
MLGNPPATNFREDTHMGPIRNSLLASASLAVLGFASPGAHANLVTDPGFEGGADGLSLAMRDPTITTQLIVARGLHM